VPRPSPSPRRKPFAQARGFFFLGRSESGGVSPGTHARYAPGLTPSLVDLRLQSGAFHAQPCAVGSGPSMGENATPGKNTPLAPPCWGYGGFRHRLKRDPDAIHYTDLALTPVDEDRCEAMELAAMGARAKVVGCEPAKCPCGDSRPRRSASRSEALRSLTLQFPLN
jgi:hypothetical protein